MYASEEYNNNPEPTVIENEEDPVDTVQDIRWIPEVNSEIFACGNWDATITFNEIQAQSGYQPKLMLERKHIIDTQEPVLSISWKSDCSMIFAALADSSIRAYDIESGQSIIIGNHEGCPARNIFWNDEFGLISIGFDKNLRIWSLEEEAKPVFEIELPAIPTVCEQDMMQGHIIYADLNEKVHWMSWGNLKSNESSMNRNPFNTEQSRLGDKSQICSVGISMQEKCISYGSIDGRVAVVDVDSKLDLTSKITFKAHKLEEEEGRGYRSEKMPKLYPVNTIEFNVRARSNWVMTGGGEGSLCFWDMNKKNKIVNKMYDKESLTAGQVSPDGNFLAFATGYDWHRGIEKLGEIGAKVGACIIEDKHLFYNQ